MKKGNKPTLKSDSVRHAVDMKAATTKLYTFIEVAADIAQANISNDSKSSVYSNSAIFEVLGTLPIGMNDVRTNISIASPMDGLAKLIVAVGNISLRLRSGEPKLLQESLRKLGSLVIAMIIYSKRETYSVACAKEEEEEMSLPNPSSTEY